MTHSRCTLLVNLRTVQLSLTSGQVTARGLMHRTEKNLVLSNVVLVLYDIVLRAECSIYLAFNVISYHVYCCTPDV